MTSKKEDLLTILVMFLIGLVAIFGGVMFMNHKREQDMYKHGFRLFEEQIGRYIIEHYSGVEKVEFSPIFIDTDGMFTAKVVPVIYDLHGNKAYLGRPVKGGKNGYKSYGLRNGLEWDSGTGSGDEVIYLVDYDLDKEYDVSKYKKLPNFAKLKSDETIDANINEIVEKGVLKDVKKDSKGSPRASIIYNLKVKKGSYMEWR